MEQNRFKSWALWTAIGSQVIAILLIVGWLDVGQSEIVSKVLAGVLQLAVLFGVLNNPTNPNGI